MPPLPIAAQPPALPLDGDRRIAELEEQLARANETIAELTRECAELRARVGVPQRSEPETEIIQALDGELEVLDSLPPRLEPVYSSVPAPYASMPAPYASVPAPVSLEPLSLSRLVVSTPPAAPTGSEPPPELLADGDRPSQLDRPSSIERRRRARLGCEFEIEFLGDTHLIAGLSQDISEGGVFVATYQRLVIGSTVTLGLELPSGRVEVRGQVRWERAEIEDSDQRPGFGVAFTELAPEALAALTEFCRQHPAHYYEM
ncbi:MAG TPA: PilZ domain-containing protein [Polyangiaceae bacterium]|nr:PilZ domain-containing protein [Polyangiaceae bacterium]